MVWGGGFKGSHDKPFVRSKGRQRKETGQRLQELFFIVNVQFQLILQTCTLTPAILLGTT